jgi:hypothetical protein
VENPTIGRETLLSSNDITLEFRSEVEDEEMKLESNPRLARKQLIELRDQILVSEIEIHHNEQYQQIVSFFITYIDDQLIGLGRELQEYLYYE